VFEETNTASEHHMDVDLDLGDPPTRDEKKGGRFFFLSLRRDTLLEIYAFIHPSSPKNYQKQNHESWIFGRVRRFPPHPIPPQKKTPRNFPELF